MQCSRTPAHQLWYASQERPRSLRIELTKNSNQWHKTNRYERLPLAGGTSNAVQCVNQNISQESLCNRRPWHRNQDCRLHLLDQGYRLVHRIAPTFDTPAPLTACTSLLQVGKLPQVMYSVQVANLHKPGSDTLHHFTPSLQSPPPVRLPLEQVPGMQSVRSELEDTSQLARGRCRPKREFLHQRNLLGVDQLSQLAVEAGKFRMVGDIVT